MNSLDTNVLIYATNEDCAEHHQANQIVNQALTEPDKWIIADQVLFEYYKALRHPKILSNPMSAEDASRQICFLREDSGFTSCCYQIGLWNEIATALGKHSFPYQRVYDLILAMTLIQNGVKTFYTRNIKDFTAVGFKKLINPID